MPRRSKAPVTRTPNTPHPSYVRLLEVAHEAGKPTTPKALAQELGYSVQLMHMWRHRGVSSKAALAIQETRGWGGQYIMFGEGAKFMTPGPVIHSEPMPSPMAQTQTPSAEEMAFMKLPDGQWRVRLNAIVTKAQMEQLWQTMNP